METQSAPPALLAEPERRLLAGWGGTPRSAADVYATPDARSAQALVARGRLTNGVLARGLGRSYGDASLNAGGAVADMTHATGIRRVDLEAGTVTVAAGMGLDALIAILLPLGFFVPVTPG